MSKYVTSLQLFVAAALLVPSANANSINPLKKFAQVAPIKTPADNTDLVSTVQFSNVDEVQNWLNQYEESKGLLQNEDGTNIPTFRSNDIDERAQLREKISTLSSDDQLREVLTYITKSSTSCAQFIGATGPGDLGKTVLGEINNFSNVASGADDLMNFCPSYGSISNEDQSRVWLLILTTMAFLESSCNTKAQARGPNGTLRGLFQLHLGKEARYASTPRCEKNDSKKSSGSVVCTLGMLDDQISRTNEVFSTDSYWGVLRQQGEPHPKKAGKRIVKSRLIQDALVALPICYQ